MVFGGSQSLKESSFSPVGRKRNVKALLRPFTMSLNRRRLQKFSDLLDHKIFRTGMIGMVELLPGLPGSRATFVSAKVAKTSDALPGRIE